MSNELLDSSSHSIPEKRIRPPRPTGTQKPEKDSPGEIFDTAAAPASMHRGSNIAAESVHFGVVGEGSSQKILVYRSSGSLANLPEEEFASWTCDGCFYENGNDTNRSCAMCGTQQKNSPAETTTMMPIVEDDGADWDAFVNTRQAAPPVKKTPPSTSKRPSSMRKLLVKRLSSSGMIDAELTVDSLLQARNREQKEKKDDLTTSLARLSITDAGGWTCPVCTFVITDPNFLTCEVCGTEKPPKEAIAKLSQSSIQDFLTNSVKASVTSDTAFIDPQVQAYMKFEHMAARKDMMTSMAMQSSMVLEEATQRSSEQLSKEELSELQGILDEGQATLSTLKTFYEQEKKDYEAMDQLQMTRALEIENFEGASPQQVLSERATKPGVQRVSGPVLEWHGQQRMLDDWKMQLDTRKTQIEQLQTQQKDALERLLRH